MTYVVHRTTDGLDRVLGEAFRVESSQWKGRAGTAMASRPDTESFYRGVAYAAAAGGTLHLATLRLDGRVVSFELGVRVAGRHFALKSGFDPVYRRFSPGHLLCERIINDAIAARMSRYEMLGHSDTYKHRWSDRAHRIVVLEFLARSPRGLASYVALLARREARSLVAPVARRTRRALGRLRGVSLRRNA